MHTNESQKQLEEALIEFLMRKRGVKHPSGDFTPANRWIPDASENLSCCNGKHRHAYSLVHVATMFNVDQSELKKLSRKLHRKLADLPPIKFWQKGDDWTFSPEPVEQRYIERFSIQIRAVLTELRLTETLPAPISATVSSTTPRKLRF